MRKFLHHDPETRELRLVYTDYYQGQHERTEYRVLSDRTGEVLHNMTDFDGERVLGHAPDLYVKRGPWGEHTIPVRTEEKAVAPTVRTPCPKAANRRRKCALCAQEAGTP